MAEEYGPGAGGTGDDPSAGPRPAGPFLREYQPTGPFRQGGARTTSVLFYRRGHSVAGISGITHHDKPPLARPHTICEIAAGTYVTTLRMELPAAGGATFFKAEVDIHWTVEDPHLVAVEVVTDIAERLTAPTLERLRDISAQYPVHQAEQANTAITRTCVSGRWNDLGADLGLRVRLYVRLRVDDRTIGHTEAVREEASGAELNMIRQQRYLTMLRGGELEQLSHMLAADPEAANSFLEQIRQEGRQDEKDRVDRLFDLVASGQIPSSEMDAQALAYLNRERLSIQGPVGGRPARRTPRELEPARDEPFSPDWVSDEPPVRRPRPDRDRSRDQDRDWDWDWDRDESRDRDWDRDESRNRDGDRRRDRDSGPAPRARAHDDGWGWAEDEG
ncbi:hypothetical protein AB0935_08300 [Streptomyces sp. NPDC007027]|uniref:hypothetical protein n=1 Tax=Streptomyces sp. NPDC007027 TaxID=3157086 RepID=UPI0034513058